MIHDCHACEFRGGFDESKSADNHVDDVGAVAYSSALFGFFPTLCQNHWMMIVGRLGEMLNSHLDTDR